LTRTHYTDYEPTSLCSNSLMLHTEAEKQQIPIILSLILSDHDLQHSRRAC